MDENESVKCVRHEIHLYVTPDGNFSFINPSTRSSTGNLRAKPGDSVFFNCDHPFAIRFQGRPPAHQIDFWPGESSFTIPADAAPGKYKYTIAIFDGARIWLDDSSPEIIIEWKSVRNT